MKIAERIVIVLLLLVLLGGGAYVYLGVQHKQQELRDAVARGDFETPTEESVLEDITEEEWRSIYPKTIPITIASTSFEASVAETLPDRIKGLSGTPFLPEGVVKLFAFGVPGNHAIWMKDMNYSLDILWVGKEGSIIHIEENIAPETYPNSFESPRDDAWFVVEANAGFVVTHGIELGDELVVKALE